MTTASLDERINAVGADREQGASELARECLRIAADSAEQEPAADTGELLALLARRAQRLESARPSMAPVQNLVRTWSETLPELSGRTLAEARATAAARARGLIEQSLAAVDSVAEQVLQLLGEGTTVITHSLSSTLTRALTQAGRRRIHVVLTESRPLCEGYILARRLAAAGVRATLITDAQLGLWMERADLAVTGADTVLADGAVVNKAGTYLLALAARDRNVPFYVCCETFKRRRGKVEAPDLEEMDASELGAPGVPGVTVRNIYFDVTPARLVSGWVHENGVSRPPAV
ncbi:MAG: translation initiation factor eIF-2B [Gammaproteobacteria bacterium]